MEGSFVVSGMMKERRSCGGDLGILGLEKRERSEGGLLTLEEEVIEREQLDSEHRGKKR